MLQFARHSHRSIGDAGDGRAPDVPSLTIGEIAEIEGLTPQYAGKLIRILRMGGLLESVRGRHGGYRLSQTVEKISVGEVLGVLGGRVFEPAYCSRYTGDRKLCVHSVDCAIRSLWGALQGMMDGILSRIFLKDLMGKEEGVAKLLRSLAVADDFPPRPPEEGGDFPPRPPQGGDGAFPPRPPQGGDGAFPPRPPQGGDTPVLLEVAMARGEEAAALASPRAPSRAKGRRRTQSRTETKESE